MKEHEIAYNRNIGLVQRGYIVVPYNIASIPCKEAEICIASIPCKEAKVCV